MINLEKSKRTASPKTKSLTHTVVSSSNTSADQIAVGSGSVDRKGYSLLDHALESFAVGVYVFSFVFAPILLTILALIVLFCPPLWVFALPYICWYIYDYQTPKTGSRPWETFQNLRLWIWMANYFPMCLIKTAELTTDRNYIIGSHPHGILSFSTFLAFCTESVGFADLFPGFKRRYAVTLPMQYWFPIRRELLMLTNTISLEMSAIEHVLKNNKRRTAVAITLGGAAEALDSLPDNYKLTLKNRKGFVKLALKYGICLKASSASQCHFFYGRSFFNYFVGFMPFRTPIHCVVGKPIIVEKVIEPTNKHVYALHHKYLFELSDLFDAHKHKYGISAQTKLEFV